MKLWQEGVSVGGERGYSMAGSIRQGKTKAAKRGPAGEMGMRAGEGQ
jgi:hypothetical protein